MSGVKIGNYTYYKSSRKDKKLEVIVNGKKIHFGNPIYSHFFDKTGLLDKKLNHKDENIRKAWKARHTKIKDGTGGFAYKNPNSPSYHSFNVIW